MHRRQVLQVQTDSGLIVIIIIIVIILATIALVGVVVVIVNILFCIVDPFCSSLSSLARDPSRVPPRAAGFRTYQDDSGKILRAPTSP